MRYPPKLWKDLKVQQDWFENQSLFTTKGKQSANNTKEKKLYRKKQHYIPPQHTLSNIFLHICMASFLFHFLLLIFFFLFTQM